MCWQGWNPDHDSIEWRDRCGTGRIYSQKEVHKLNRESNDRARQKEKERIRRERNGKI